MPRVRNLATGLEHDVPAGHFSLASAEYATLPDRPTRSVEAVQEADQVPKRATKARTRKE